METFHFKRQFAFDVFELIDDAQGALVPGGANLRPTGANIGKGEAVNKIAGGRIAAMRHGVGFDVAEAGSLRRPVAQRNVMTQEFAWSGSAEAAAAMSKTHRLEQPIQCGRAHREEIAPDGGREFRQKIQPQRQGGLEQF